MPPSFGEVNVTDTNNHQHYKKIDVGFSVEKLLKKLLQEKKISERQESDRKFRKEAKLFIIAVLSKLFNKCSLYYSLVRNVACLDPRQMSSKPDDCKGKFKKNLHIGY